MRFRVEIFREGVGTATIIEEEDLEKMFQPYMQVKLLEAYAKNIEDKFKMRGKHSV